MLFITEATLTLSNGITHSLTSHPQILALYEDVAREWTWDELYHAVAKVAAMCLDQLWEGPCSNSMSKLAHLLSQYPGLWVYDLSEQVCEAWIRTIGESSDPILTDAARTLVVGDALRAFVPQEPSDSFMAQLTKTLLAP